MEPEKHMTQVLIIEDSPTQARMIGIILEKAGYQVFTAKTGIEGVDMAISLQPDIILLDVILPDMDGFTVCRRLRQNIAAYIPILILTEKRTSIEDKIDGLNIGADDYLPKPFDEREFLARVGALVRIKQIIDDLRSRLQQGTQSYEVLKRIALTDHLTGLYNRHYFIETIEREFSLATRYQTALSCMMVDVDDFHVFNTKYGRPIGDWILQKIANSLSNTLRHPEVLGRFSGDEFIALLPVTDGDAALEVARRLQNTIASTAWESPAGTLNLRVSIGIATIPADYIANVDQLISCTDRALYKAKEAGKNGIHLYRPD